MTVLVTFPAFTDGFIVLPEPVKQVYSSSTLEVKYHYVKITIKGQHTVTVIDQEFHNPTHLVLSGEHVVPVPKYAAIKKFSVLLGGHVVRVELLDVRQARDLYIKILKQQCELALLEYDGMNLYRARMCVS